MAYLLNQADRQVFNTVLPAIRDSLDLSDASVGLIATIFNLFYALMVPIAGWVGDWCSKKWVCTISLLFWSLATTGTFLASCSAKEPRDRGWRSLLRSGKLLSLRAVSY